MKNSINKVYLLIVLISTVGFMNCENTNDLLTEPTIQDKVQMLESSEWLLKGFEDRIMHTFNGGEKFTYYGTNSVFDQPIPGTKDYEIEGDLLKIDFHFGNISTFQVKFSCDNNIVEFYKEDELNMTLLKRGSNYQQCL